MTRTAVVLALAILTAFVVAAPAASANYAPCDLHHEPPVGTAMCTVVRVTFTVVCTADLEDRVC